jgi:hypothetical protein
VVYVQDDNSRKYGGVGGKSQIKCKYSKLAKGELLKTVRCGNRKDRLTDKRN